MFFRLIWELLWRHHWLLLSAGPAVTLIVVYLICRFRDRRGMRTRVWYYSLYATVSALGLILSIVGIQVFYARLPLIGTEGWLLIVLIVANKMTFIFGGSGYWRRRHEIKRQKAALISSY